MSERMKPIGVKRCSKSNWRPHADRYGGTSVITVRHEALKLDFHFVCICGKYWRKFFRVSNSLYSHWKMPMFSLLCKCIPLKRQIYTAITASFEGEKQIWLFLASYHQIRKQPPHLPQSSLSLTPSLRSSFHLEPMSLVCACPRGEHFAPHSSQRELAWLILYPSCIQPRGGRSEKKKWAHRFQWRKELRAESRGREEVPSRSRIKKDAVCASVPQSQKRT